MDKPVRTLVVAGGGSAGWITAGYIAAKHKAEGDGGLKVKIIESPNIPTIGVGEGTWPTMRTTLKTIGVRETDFFRECDASFKQGAKFAQWVTGAPDDFYYHPLVLPQGFLECNLVPAWLKKKTGTSFSAATCFQEHICEKDLAPKQITTPEYAGMANYAYHLNAGKFSNFLREHCLKNLDVELIADDITGVNSAENGDIASLQTAKSGAIEGDLFVDCTGFRSLLLGQHYDIPFQGCKDTLFIDRALAVQIPYFEGQAIASHTISTAQEAGWIWDIGLSTRRGIGHVFSSAHMKIDEAEKKLRQYVAPYIDNPDSIEIRQINIEPGHRTEFWHRNCVAVGLSAGFLEPLEASALVLIELSARMISDQMPATRGAMDIVAKRFNRKFSYRWDRIIDFLKLHYILSQRTDHEFWVDNRRTETIPDSLQELMELWQYQSPWHDDFDHKDEVFPSASYQFVLYGMGFQTAPSPRPMSAEYLDFADEQFRRVDESAGKLAGMLPTNRELISKIHEFGLQTV